MIRTSQPGWNEGAITLSASRSRLRTRFRTTAPPSLRPVESPKRVTSRSVRRVRITSRGWDLTVPSPCNAAKSSGLESVTRRGELWPRSAVRPSASCVRERGERPTRGVPRRSSSGSGSRVLWRDAASWAGRSASSDGVFLSIRPRGQDTPKGTRTRLAPVSALARLPADYMYGRLGVSNVAGSRGPRGGAARTSRPILPRSMRFATFLSLAPGARAVLFFVGPRRQTNQGVGPEGPREPPGCSGGETGPSVAQAPGRRLVDQVPVTILAIQLDLDQD